MGTVALYAGGVLVFVLGLFLSVAMHELGHLHYAKRYGCRVSQYVVGVGPKLVSWTRGETEYRFHLVPFGGYVKIIGMLPPAPEGDDASSRGVFARMIAGSRLAEQSLVRDGDEGRLFYQLPWRKKAMIMFAGPAVNVALAFTCFLAVYSIHGVHSSEPTGSIEVTYVSECVLFPGAGQGGCTKDDPVSPAAAAGLEVGDEIVSVNGRPVSEHAELTNLVEANGDDRLELQVQREVDGRSQRVDLTPTSTAEMPAGQGESVGYLGVTFESREVVTRQGPIYTMGRMGQMTAQAARTIAELPGRVVNVGGAVIGVTEREPDGPMSVVGGSRMAGEVAVSNSEGMDVSAKVALLVLVIGSLNLFMGMFNLVPLLPLDGGHIFGALWEGLRGWIARFLRRDDPGPVDVARQLPLAYCFGFALVGMGLVLMIGDIVVPLQTGL